MRQPYDYIAWERVVSDLQARRDELAALNDWDEYAYVARTLARLQEIWRTEKGETDAL